jgi:hypothetical protein
MRIGSSWGSESGSSGMALMWRLIAVTSAVGKFHDAEQELFICTMNNEMITQATMVTHHRDPRTEAQNCQSSRSTLCALEHRGCCVRFDDANDRSRLCTPQ